MGSARVLGEKKPQRLKRKLPGPSVKSCKPDYNKVLKTLRKIGARKPAELDEILNSTKPGDERKKTANELFNIPGVLSALEEIMLKNMEYDVAAALFVSLFRHREDVELTTKQRILYKLVLNHEPDLLQDLEFFGHDAGTVLTDILTGENNIYVKLEAVDVLREAELSPKDLERLARLVFVNEVDDEDIRDEIVSIYDDRNIAKLVPFIASRFLEDDDLEQVVVGLGKPMLFPIVGMLLATDNPAKIIRILGEIGDERAVPALRKFYQSEDYDPSLDPVMQEAIHKIQSSQDTVQS